MQELIDIYYSLGVVFIVYELLIIIKTKFFLSVLDYTEPKIFVPSKEYFFHVVHYIMSGLLFLWSIVGLFTSASGLFFCIFGWAGCAAILGNGYLRMKFSSIIYILLFFLIMYSKYNHL